MSHTWDYPTELGAGMVHTMQVQTDSDGVDFNLYVVDSVGSVLAEDTGPEPGAELTLTTVEAVDATVRVELLEGAGSFSLKISSQSAPRGRATGASPTGATAPAPAAVASKLTAAEIEGLVAAHNRWRARFDVPPLEWSASLASYAQQWADELAPEMQMRHRSPNVHGENLYWCSGKSATPDEVVDAWGSEEQFYDYDENNWWPKAGHFSQVIWHDTIQVGGGVVRRDDQEIWVCNYAPSGNYAGQRPYER